MLSLTVDANLNYLISVGLFSFRFLYIAYSNYLWILLKSGGSLTLTMLWVLRTLLLGDIAFFASFYRKSFYILGGSLALVNFSWAVLAILSFRTISSYFFLFRRSTEQNHGMGLAWKINSCLYSFVFFWTFLFSKLNGRSLAKVIIMLLFFLSSFFFCCSVIIFSKRPTSLTLGGIGPALNLDYSVTISSCCCRERFISLSFSLCSKEKGFGTVIFK